MPVGRVGTEAFDSSEGSAIGVVSLGFGVKVTVEVIATGAVGAKGGETFEGFLPHGGQGLGADIALLARKLDKRRE